MNRKLKNLIIALAVGSLFLCITFIVAFEMQHSNERKYTQADDFFNAGEYSKAREIYISIEKYKDSKKLAKKMRVYEEKKEIYENALENYRQGKLSEAIEMLNKIIGFEDAESKYNEITYELAKNMFNDGDLNSARKYFLLIENYKDSSSYLSRIEIKKADSVANSAYLSAKNYYNSCNYNKAFELFNDLGNYKDSKSMANLCKENIKRCELSNIMAVGTDYLVGIQKNGTLEIVGDSSEGKMNIKSWENIISVDAYGSFIVGLKNNGRVKSAGYINGKQKADVTDWTDIIDIAAGERYIVGLKNDGDVVATGHNGDGQCNVYSKKWKNIIDIDAGWRFTVGLTKQHKLIFTGIDNGQANEFQHNQKDWKNVVKISASGGDPSRPDRGKGHTVGLTNNQTVVAIGDNTFGQCDVSNWKDIKKAVAGDWFTVGLRNDNTVLFTGTNRPGSKYIDTKKLKKLNEKKDIVDIAAGYGQTLFLHKDGSVSTFGFNDYVINHWRIMVHN